MEEIENESMVSEEEDNESVTSTTMASSSCGANHSPVMANDTGGGIVLPPKNKRKRSTDVRRRIRKIMLPEQLDSQTVSAQNEEKERLRRLELQKSLSTLKSGDVGEKQSSTPPPLDSPLDTGNNRPAASPVFVDVPSKKPKPIIIIDDSDNDSDDDCDVVETRNFVADPIIEISDSGSDSEIDVAGVDDAEPETSGSHTNDDVNQPNAEGRVLVNVNHPPTEPDIFLSPYLSKCVKPHQIGGIRFLYDNLVESLSRFQVSPGFGCILAHSMGLGKTLQLICFIDVLLDFTKATKVLCIVPMNTIQNWNSEFNTWLPEKTADEQPGEDTDDSVTGTTDAQNKVPKTRNYKVYLLSDGVKTTVARSTLIGKWYKNGGVLLMGYEMYRILAMYAPSLANNTKLMSNKRRKATSTSTEVIDLDEEEKNMDLLLEIQKALCKPGPDLVVCDEGHRIKNNQANVSQALKRIHTRRRVVLTGYPLQNNLLEYWCMVDFVRPNFLGTRHEFSNMFERPIVNGQCVDSTAADTKLMRFRAHVLHSLLEGFVQRRSEAVLRKTLPEKEEYVVPVKMSPIQMSLYNAFVSSVRNYVGYVNPIRAFSISIKIWNHPDILKHYLDRKTNGSRNDSPLTVVDPDLDIGENLAKKIKESKSETSRRVVGVEGGMVVSSEIKATIANSTDWVGNLLDDYEPDVLQNGTKMVILTEIIEKTVAMGDKLLVFSQSLSTLTMIEDFLRKRVVPPRPSQLLFQPVHWERNKNYYRLDGGTSSQERDKLITAFNLKTNESVFVFLLSTRACSLGVNLIGANRVVIFDASWNPCHDAQAICRVYRYGQTKKCFIYRLVSSGTFEKRMYERQVTKQGMSDRVIDELNPEANLTKQEVMSLFNETEPEVKESANGVSASSPDKFADPVLNHVCEMLEKAIDEIPFKHKLQTSQRSRNTLTKAEKREAKKGYEREKRAIISANRFVPIAENTTAIVREQMRREAIARPIGHVKPLQNVLPNASFSSRIPSSLLLPVPPAFPHRSMATIPSMAFFPPVSHPSMSSYGRYFSPGELRSFPPYAKNPAAMSSDGGMRKRETPIIVNLLTENEDGSRTSFGGKTENTKTSETTCVSAQTTSAAVKTGGFCHSAGKDPQNFVMLVDDTGQSFSGNPSTCNKNDGSLSLSLPHTAATSSDGTHTLSVNPSKCSADDAIPHSPGVLSSSSCQPGITKSIISMDPAATRVKSVATRVESVDGLSADVAMPSVDDTGRSSPVVTSECSSESRNVVDSVEGKVEKCGAVVAETKSEKVEKAETKSENDPTCSKEVAEV